MGKQKIALVTGASRGIGKAIAHSLAQQGLFVVGTATSEKGAQAITEGFATASLAGQGICLDVADNTSVEHTMKKILKDIGVISVLINNAGITRDNLLLRMQQDDWEAVINTNLTSVYRVVKACLRPMMKNRFGRIISITSVVGLSGNAGQANYASAKAGIVGFTKSLAHEVGTRNITVNAVAPGFIETDMTKKMTDEQREAALAKIPLRRLGKVEDIAATVNFLASENAAYITGQTLQVNGGIYML